MSGTDLGRIARRLLDLAKATGAAVPVHIDPPPPPVQPEHTRLRVWRLDRPSPLLRYRWTWQVTTLDGRALDGAVAPSWAEALAVGLAALEQASACGMRRG